MKYSDKLIQLYEKFSKLNFLLSCNLQERKQTKIRKPIDIPDDLYRLIKSYYLQNRN